MKNKIKIALGVALGVLTISSFAQLSFKHKSQLFLNGQMLVISNNTTVTNITVGAAFIGPTFLLTTSGTSSNVVYTNASAGLNITNTYVSPTWETDIQTYADGNGLIMSNQAVTVVYNNTNFAFALNMPTNQLANANWTNSYFTLTNSYQNISTNISNSVVTFVFQKACYGRNFDTVTGDQFSFSFVAVSNVAGVFVTNFPNSFLEGAGAIRLLSVATGNSNGTCGVLLNQVAYGGFTAL